MLKNINFTQVKIIDDFWNDKLNVWKKTLIRNCLDKCYETGRIDNFKIAGNLMEGEWKGIYFNDSDVYKVLEGAAYFLQLEKDPALEEEIDAIISYIAAAQEEDGYLCTFYTLVEPDKKWTDMERHEMYCGGHMIEAAVAYYQATGKDVLLKVAVKMVNHYLRVFGEGKRNWVEGHQEIELALVKLYKVTGKAEYLKFAKWLLGQRGKGLGIGTIWQKDMWGPAYCQDDVLVTDIKEAVGHSVRAIYMYASMADLLGIGEGNEYEQSLINVWDDIHNKKMYLTGGVGSARENEGFMEPYFLPNESAYAETCASIANVYFNHHMNLIYKDSKYADVIERSIYNGILSGISLDGSQFFYVNPMASVGEHHRKEWYDCSCCPTNLARFLPSIGNYIFAEELSEDIAGADTDITSESVNSLSFGGDVLIVNQYIGSEYVSDKGTFTISSEFQWKGKVKIEYQDNTYQSIRLRVPSWAHEYEISVNGKKVFVIPDEHGYLTIALAGEGAIKLKFANPLRKVACNEQVKANRGKIAFAKGPFVYCAEQVDNPDFYYDELSVAHDYKFQRKWDDELNVEKVSIFQTKYPFKQRKVDFALTLIPYFAWDNRKEGTMKVWLGARKKGGLYE